MTSSRLSKPWVPFTAERLITRNVSRPFGRSIRGGSARRTDDSQPFSPSPVSAGSKALPSIPPSDISPVTPYDRARATSMSSSVYSPESSFPPVAAASVPKRAKVTGYRKQPRLRTQQLPAEHDNSSHRRLLSIPSSADSITPSMIAAALPPQEQWSSVGWPGMPSQPSTARLASTRGYPQPPTPPPKSPSDEGLPGQLSRRKTRLQRAVEGWWDLPGLLARSETLKRKDTLGRRKLGQLPSVKKTQDGGFI